MKTDWRNGDRLTADDLNEIAGAVASTTTVSVVTEEVTQGTKDGVNTEFATTYAIVPGTLALFRNGLHQIEGNCYCEIDNDPHLFKTATPPLSNDVLTVIYRTADQVSVPGEVDVLPGTDRGVPINGTRQIKKDSIGLDRLTDDAIATLSNLVTSVAGRQGAIVLTKTDVGLDNTDNTADADKPVSSATRAALDDKQDTAHRNQANGYAGLDSSALIPSILLPSYVDDVLEYANIGACPSPGMTGKIYVTLDNSKIYRWSGSDYIEISSSPGSTDAVPEGLLNLYHTTARASAAAPVQQVAGRTGNISLAKNDVGLGNVDNTADANKAVLSATKLATARKINGVSFDGSADVTVPGTVRVATITSSATPTISIDTTDAFTITALAVDMTSVTLSGTPREGQRLLIRIKDDGTAARNLTWGSSIISSGTVTLLARTLKGKTHLTQLIYDAVAAKWVAMIVDSSGY